MRNKIFKLIIKLINYLSEKEIKKLMEFLDFYYNSKYKSNE